MEGNKGRGGGGPGDNQVPSGFIEAEILAARAALEEAREMLEGMVEKAGEALEERTEGQVAEAPP